MFFYAYNRYTVLTLKLTIFQKFFIILNFAYMRRSMYATINIRFIKCLYKHVSKVISNIYNR